MKISSALGHTFTFPGDSIRHRHPAGREVELGFSRLRLRFSPWSGDLFLRGPNGKISLSSLEPAQQRELLLELFRRWKIVDAEAAKKAAFDYVDGQRQFLPMAFIVSLCFSLPLSVALLNDSREQRYCTAVLQNGSTLGTMDVTKFKKKRKGHYILQLRFVAPNGAEILGQDQLILGKEGLDEEIEARIPKTVPVVYSPTEPKCWSLTPNLEGTEVNWAKRRFFAAFSALFGGFFLITALLGLAWPVLSWMRKRPHRAEIAQAFSL